MKRNPRSKRGRSSTKSVLRLPDPEHAKAAVLNSLKSTDAKRGRRHEAVALTLDHLQQREEHWAIVDLVGKGGHVRTVLVPDWVRRTGQLARRSRH
jgi:hypothetical protein